MKLSRRQKRILKRKLKRIAGDAVAVIVGAGMFVGLLIAWANEPMPDWSEYTEETQELTSCLHTKKYSQFYRNSPPPKNPQSLEIA